VIEIGFIVAVTGYIASLITAVGWCDCGFLGYPDYWHSEIAELIYYIGAVATAIGLIISVVGLFIT
jgi:hypothetical protein